MTLPEKEPVEDAGEESDESSNSEEAKEYEKE